MKRKVLGTTLLLCLTLSGCSSEGVQRAAYEAAYQKGCMDRTGATNCDPGHKTYEEYQKERSQLSKPDPR